MPARHVPGRHRPRRCLRLGVVAAVVVAIAALVAPAASFAAGSGSIAGATNFPYGTPVSGGGLPNPQYWRLPVVGGDKLTLDSTISGSSTDCTFPDFEIFQPSVTDFTVGNAGEVALLHPGAGMDQLVWTSPFTGAGILRVDDCAGPINSFTMTITDAHATSIALTAPTLAKIGSKVAVTAIVSSPAGTPTGNCLINGGSPVPVTAGQCVAHLRASGTAHAIVRVAYVPDPGWQPATAKRTIRLYR